MGFGTIFATIAMVVIIGAASYLIITGALFSMDTLSKSLKIANEIDNAKLKTAIDITNITVPDNTTINLSINNTGSTKILKSNYKYIDLFVHYNASGIGNITKWIPYNDTAYSALQDNEWTKVSIAPDLINPEMFDPDEQMKIVIRVEPAIGENSTNWLKVVTPNGVSASKYF